MVMEKIRNKILALELELCRSTLERETEIRGVLLALLSQCHVALIGPPGTGKSQIAADVAEAMGGLTQFSHLMTRWTTPDEVLGHLSIKGLKEDKYVYCTEGKLPRAQFAYLDELFNAPSSLLNTLLNILNERTFQGEWTPLETMVCSSNQLPEGLDEAGADVQSSRALYDRILLRYIVKALQTDRAFIAVAFGRTCPPEVEEVLTTHDLKAVQFDIRTKVTFAPETLQAVLLLRAESIRSGLNTSDRRWKQALMGPVRAAAWMRGSYVVELRDLDVMAHILWDTPDQIALVAAMVYAVAWPSLNAARATEAEMATQLRALRVLGNNAQDNAKYIESGATLSTRLMHAIASVRKLQENGDHPELMRIARWLVSARTEVSEGVYARTNSGTTSVLSSVSTMFADMFKN